MIDACAHQFLLYGMRILENPNCVQKIHHPVRTHKKKRLRKKWLKKYGTWIEYQPTMYVIRNGAFGQSYGKAVVAHPSLAMKLRIIGDGGTMKMEDEYVCKYCGGKRAIRNPTGKCDHLYWPDNLTDEAKIANGYRFLGIRQVWVKKVQKDDAQGGE